MRETVQRPIGGEETRAYSVSELTREIKMILEGAYPQVLLEGEVSNFKAASSGHWYFTLKDREAMIQAVMFRGSQRGLSRIPADGMMVRVRGNVSVYAQRGNYQIICSSMEFGGEGQILQMLEERKRALAAEGLFDPDKKRPLPLFPREVAVLSAETGAAVRDIINVLSRRAPWLLVRVVNIPVQGAGAPPRIVEAIQTVQQHGLGQVIILGRGGGSLEDLLAFSDEAVVRAVAESEIPIISAVGHEIDWALSDYAADLRAPTPSAAAELLCSNADELMQRVMAAGKTIVHSYLGMRSRLELAVRPFRSEILEESFRRMLQPHAQNLDDQRERLTEGMNRLIEARRRRLELASRELAACDPFAVLQRGYAMVRSEDGAVIPSAAGLARGDAIDILFRDGSVPAAVTSKDTI
jgi:exodeoxyribonuclease VII large subunit